MGISLQSLRESRSVLAQEVQSILASATGVLDSEKSNKVDEKLAAVEAIDKQMAQIENAQRLAIESAANDDLRNQFTTTPGAHSGTPDESKALRAFLAGGLGALDPAARQRMHARQSPEVRAVMGGAPLQINNAMRHDDELRGQASPSRREYMRSVLDAQKRYGGMLQVATVMPTMTGAQMNWPTADSTAEEGEIIGQNATTSVADTNFGTLALGAYMYSSKSIAIPFELIQDSMVDMDAYIQALLVRRLGRVTNKHYTIGAGSTEPFGIVTGATAGKVGAGGTGLTISYDDLVSLEHSVDPSYREIPGAGYMFHDSTLSAIRKVKDSQNRPIFVPGYETGVPQGAPDLLLGRPITINQSMPVMAINAKSILFGNFRAYIVRQVMDLTIFRMTDSAYTLKRQVGFVAYQRADGRLMDVGGAVKYYQNGAS
jgi:HK97 family phage major capsid protein